MMMPPSNQPIRLSSQTPVGFWYACQDSISKEYRQAFRMERLYCSSYPQCTDIIPGPSTPAHVNCLALYPVHSKRVTNSALEKHATGAGRAATRHDLRFISTGLMCHMVNVSEAFASLR